MIVLKFGGTSVGTAQSLANVKKIVEHLDTPAIVVVSALGGLTDKLIATARMASSGNMDFLKEMDAIALRHHNIIQDVIAPAKALATRAKIDPILQELKRLYEGVCLIADLPSRTLDQIVSTGERMSSIIVADMIEGASHHNSLDFIKTEKWFDRNIADTTLTDELIRHEFTTDTKYPAVTGGFISSDKNTQEITNLGRGGSDYTAALIAAALNADVLQIWTDVDGFLTADPRIIPSAHVIDVMSFVESMDLCSFGAKVIYPPTIYPVFHKNIPIRILNTFRPDAVGTYITDSSEIADGKRSEIAGISSLKNVSMLSLRLSEGQSLPDLSTRTINALARKGISTLLTDMHRDHNTLSVIISANDSQTAIKLVKEEFAPELVDRIVEVIELIDGLATVAIVGDGIKKLPALNSIVTDALSQKGVKIHANSDGTSETTLSFVISEECVGDVLTTLHSIFFE